MTYGYQISSSVGVGVTVRAEAVVVKMKIQILECALKQNKHLIDTGTHTKFTVPTLIYNYIKPISINFVSR